ncbi:hypothetical protein JMY81_15660 [Brenneria goodwinii]|uniref:Uncharacterized protein n=1 Tax=Brenneria goodwinii TaxID=1109412 RepID=A0A0G4JYK7_9GAMM|nr:hypothetical protein [Brenneria goodwinii]MCG8157292.1 hypothetical protein [Brenneria goodwinii]MCG8162246.1 hypothetical protein [Brenneria goodwinii]MCG8166176.1 hypothetical protein [Brenneria goodwinii]MCG8170803.1 hypothetical protein [Brenneria goodwinii]MCG8175873.1 hypothetical protein [Brenneria goodwinii]
MVPAARIEQQIQECGKQGITVAAIVAIAGTTDFGSIDPLSEIAGLVRKFARHGNVELVFLRVVVINPCVEKEHILFMLQDQLDIASDIEQNYRLQNT